MGRSVRNGQSAALATASNLMLVALSLYAITYASASVTLRAGDHSKAGLGFVSPAATFAGSAARVPFAASVRKVIMGTSLFQKPRASIMAPLGLRMADAAAGGAPPAAGIFTVISDGVKTAMKAKDSQRLSALRGIKAALQTASKVNNVEVLADEDCLPILRKLAKQRVESIEAFVAGNRQEMADGEKFELDVINEFLPTLADEATTRK